MRLRSTLFHDFRSFLPSIVDGRGSSTDLAFSSLSRCPQIFETCRLGCCQRVFHFRNSLAISRTPPKFLEILVLFVPHTRELLRRELEHVSRPGGGGCESSRTLARSLFLFSVFSFRPGNLGLFGALLQPPAPEKKNLPQIYPNPTTHLGGQIPKNLILKNRWKL